MLYQWVVVEHGRADALGLEEAVYRLDQRVIERVADESGRGAHARLEALLARGITAQLDSVTVALICSMRENDTKPGTVGETRSVDKS